MKRHPNISLRQTQATCLARSNGFSRENVSEFFDLLELQTEFNCIPAKQVWNEYKKKSINQRKSASRS